MQEKGVMTVGEAGRKGGLATSAGHGHEFYATIGHKGGTATLKRYGRKFFLRIGLKGRRRVLALIAQRKSLVVASRR